MSHATKLKNFDRTNLKVMRSAIDNALATVTKEYGVIFSVGTIRFEQTNFRTTLTANIATNGATTPEDVRLQAYRENFARYHDSFNLKKTELGTKRVASFGVVELIGIKLGRSKHNLIVRKCENGKYYRVSAYDWQRMLAA